MKINTNPCDTISHLACEDCTRRVRTVRNERLCTAICNGGHACNRIAIPVPFTCCLQHQMQQRDTTSSDLRSQLVNYIQANPRLLPRQKRVYRKWLLEVDSLQLPDEQPDDTRRSIRSFLAYTEQLDLTMIETNSRPPSDKALWVLMEQFGYRVDDETTVILDDRNLERLPPYLDPTIRYCVWCSDPETTNSLLDRHHLEDVVLISTITGAINAPVVRCRSLRRVQYLMPWVTHIGHWWMQSCYSLEAIDFSGMESLVSVGDYWMDQCTTLVEITFNGLQNVRKVGSHWMHNCNALVTSPDFRGLGNLREVGRNWMSYCHDLESPDLTGLNSLTTIGAYCVYGCPNLVCIHLSGINRALLVIEDRAF